MSVWPGTKRCLSRGLWAGLLGLVVALPAYCAEQSQAFLDALRKREYFDHALDYLETIRKSPLVEKKFSETIDYEIGVTMLESAKLLPLVDREKRLSEAKVAFQKFITDHPTHWLTVEASAHLGNLLVERGRVKQAMTERFKQTPRQRDQLLTEARALYHDAGLLYAIVESELSDKLKSKEYTTIDPSDSRRLAERDQLRTDIMQVRLALATVVYESAQTYEPGGKDRKEKLQEAATKFSDYSKKYSRWIGGFYAKISEARCYQDLGDSSKALAILKEVIEKKEFDESYRRVRSSATALAIQICTSPQQKQYKEALEFYTSWEKNVALRAESSDEALAIKYLSGDAALECAREMKIESLESLKQRNNILQTARTLFTFTTRFPGEYGRKARVKLADPLLSGGRSRQAGPPTYEEARDRARIAWDAIRDRNITPENERKCNEESLHGFRYALAHAPADVPISELNDIRYRLAYLHWTAGEYYDAAVVGNFLARRYPNRPEAQQASKLALACYLKLLGEGEAGSAFQFEKEQMMDTAQFITERWPNSPASDEAWNILIRVAINNHELGKTVAYLNNISADSPRRGEIELLMGKTLWMAYLTAMRKPEGKRPAKHELQELFQHARSALENGISRQRKPVDVGGAVNPALAAAVLSLAQICLEAGEPAKAIGWLDDPQIGPHILISESHPYVSQGNFRTETLKATLRAYVGAMAYENLEEPLKALEKDNENNLNLAVIYRTLGLQAEDALKKTRSQDQSEQTSKAAYGLSLLLTHLAVRPTTEADFATLNWTAEALIDLAAHVDRRGDKLAPEAVEYYRKAAKTYAAMLDAFRADKAYAPDPKIIPTVQIRMARCLRQIGEYGLALNALIGVLRVQNNLLEAQREAASTYQAWGEQKPGAYAFAIKGGNPVERNDGRTINAVWGWGGIARMVQSNERLGDFFHEARYNLVLCRFLQAMAASGKDRSELLAQAKRDTMYVYLQDPEMGGQQRYAQYDALLRKIQRLLGERDGGLKIFDEPSADTAKAQGEEQ